MKADFFFLCFLHIVASSHSPTCEEAEYGCEITDNILIDLGNVTDVSQCRNICNVIDNCIFYTWKPLEHQCLAFDSCSKIDITCKGCLTGSRCSDRLGINLRIDPLTFVVSLNVNTSNWLTNNDVFYHQNGEQISSSNKKMAAQILP